MPSRTAARRPPPARPGSRTAPSGTGCGSARAPTCTSWSGRRPQRPPAPRPRASRWCWPTAGPSPTRAGCPVVELLRSRYGVRVVAFDQPGHGLSAAESRTPTVHELGEVLHRVLTAVAPTGPLVLAGHSMGGMTIMAWAADHADELADAGARGRVRGDVGQGRARTACGCRSSAPLMRASARAPRVAPGRLLSTRSQARLLYGRETARDDGRARRHAHPAHLAADAGPVVPRPAGARRDARRWPTSGPCRPGCSSARPTGSPR